MSAYIRTTYFVIRRRADKVISVYNIMSPRRLSQSLFERSYMIACGKVIFAPIVVIAHNRLDYGLILAKHLVNHALICLNAKYEPSSPISSANRIISTPLFFSSSSAVLRWRTYRSFSSSFFRSEAAACRR